MSKAPNKREVLEQSTVFKLSRVQKNGKKWYEIQYYVFGGNGTIGSFRNAEVRRFFNPGCTVGAVDSKWKFKNREEAYKKYTWANMRWT